MKKQIFKIAYVVCFLMAFAVFGVVTLFRHNDDIGNEEKTELTKSTYLTFAGNFDDYFGKDFGFRNELVDINNRIKYVLFGQSGESSVIAGSDGWLFYESALHDYVGEDVISESEAAKIAAVIEQMCEYAQACGTKLVFVSAPNKMEIYGQYMPYYYLENTDDGNYELIMNELGKSNASYVDLKKILKAAAEQSDINIYHKEDSHWNNMGASIAYNAIMDEAGIAASDYSSMNYRIENNFSGDLYGMLFPSGEHKDEQVVFDMEESFYYVSNFRSVDDMIINTANDAAEGKVLVFRDSFGNALYPFFANDFGECEFSRAIPYDLTDISGNDLVVAELVERNLANLLTMLPVMPAMETDLDVVCAAVENAEINITASENGELQLVTFDSDAIPENCIEMYFRVDNITYKAYPTAADGAGCLYVDGAIDIDSADCSVIYADNGEYYELY